MKNSCNILITGGLGFIGSAVVRYLSDNYNFNLVVVDNQSNSDLKNLGEYQDKISFFNLDIRDKDALEEVIKNCQYVIHLAANISIQDSIKDPLFSNSVNVSGFLNVLELSKKYAVKKVVYASSADVYGNCDKAVAEDHSLNPASPYGFGKMSNEFYAKFYNRNYGLSCVGLRYFNVYGSFNYKAIEYAGVIKIFIEKILNDQNADIYGDGSQERDFVFVDDVARITVESLFIDYEGAINVASGNSIRVDDLFNMIKGAISKDAAINYLPKRSGEVTKSCADITKLKSLFNAVQFKNIKEGLSLVVKSLGVSA